MPLKDKQPRLKKVLADQGYRGASVEAVKKVLAWDSEIREQEVQGFQVQWKRWIVE